MVSWAAAVVARIVDPAKIPAASCMFMGYSSYPFGQQAGDAFLAGFPTLSLSGCDRKSPLLVVKQLFAVSSNFVLMVQG